MGWVATEHGGGESTRLSLSPFHFAVKLFHIQLPDLVCFLLRIFILEGIVTVLAGLISKLWIPDWPETAKFLNEDERAMLMQRLSQDIGDARMDNLDKGAMRRIMKDWKIYLGTIAYFGIVSTGYAGSVSCFKGHILVR